MFCSLLQKVNPRVSFWWMDQGLPLRLNNSFLTEAKQILTIQRHCQTVSQPHFELD